MSAISRLALTRTNFANRTSPTERLPGHVRLELRNVVANYPFERSHRFAGIQPNLGHRDYSRAAAPGICRSAQCYHPAGVLAQTLVIDLCSLRRRAHCGNFCQSTLLFVDIPSRSSNVLSGLGKAI